MHLLSGWGLKGAGGSQARETSGSPPAHSLWLPARLHAPSPGQEGLRHGASQRRNKSLLLKMADSSPRQLQPLGLQRGLTSGPRPHPWDPTEVLADRTRGREGREPGLPSLLPIPHSNPPVCTRGDCHSRNRKCHFSGQAPSDRARRPENPREGRTRTGSPAAPYLDICCPALAAQTRSSACRGAATPHTRGSPAHSRWGAGSALRSRVRPTSRVVAAALTSCHRCCSSPPPPPPPPHPAATHATVTAAAAPPLRSRAPRGHRQPLKRAQPSPPISTPPKISPHSPPPR